MSLNDNITDNITTTFYQRKITINYLNYKLNACVDIVILLDFYIHNGNDDGYNNNATSKYVVQTNKECAEFTITGTYKLKSNTIIIPKRKIRKRMQKYHDLCQQGEIMTSVGILANSESLL